MTDLLHKLAISTPDDKLIWFILLFLTVISMISFVISFDDSNDPESDTTFKSIIISLVIFIVFAIGFGKFTQYKNNKSETAINNKDYTLQIKGGILELTSQSPYIESKQFKIIYKDDSKIQVEYNGDYYDIDKSQEQINDSN